MSSALLSLHSLVRWAVLLSAVVATAVAWRGWLGGQAWTKGARLSGVALVASADLQLLLGLALYLLVAPHAALRGGGAAEAGVRFFAFEHPTLGVGVALLAHLGSVLSRRAASDPARFRVAALLRIAALALAVLATPWPGTRMARALLPF
jgi:hypothetical protein